MFQSGLYCFEFIYSRYNAIVQIETSASPSRNNRYELFRTHHIQHSIQPAPILVVVQILQKRRFLSTLQRKSLYYSFFCYCAKKQPLKLRLSREYTKPKTATLQLKNFIKLTTCHNTAKLKFQVHHFFLVRGRNTTETKYPEIIATLTPVAHAAKPPFNAP